MAVFTKSDASSFVVGTSLADVILVPFGPFADTGAITGGGGSDELRFSSVTEGDFLVIGDNIASIERVVIGTGTGSLANTSGTLALDVDAGDALNALAITGNSGANLVLGTLFADTITGGGGADALYGGADNDIFIVASGAHHPLGELIDGESGFDTLRFTSTLAGDTLVMRADDDVEAIVIGTAAGSTSGTVALHVDASGMFNFSGTRITGNAGGNQLTGTSYGDVLTGGAGNDTLAGGEGADTLHGGAGRDVMAGGAGNDLFILGAAAELVAGEVFSGGEGVDALRIDGASAGSTLSIGGSIASIEEIRFGAALASVAVNVSAAGAANGVVIFGTGGANVITGTAFDDVLIGGAGNDVFVIGALEDLGDGFEFIEGGAGTDEVRFAGATGTLVLQNASGIERASVANGGNTGIDASALDSVRIAGGTGNNTLIGGAGNDTLAGGAGADSQDGRGGSDTYAFGAATESASGELVADTGEGEGDLDVVEFSGSGGILVLRAGTSGIELARVTGAAAIGIDASLADAALALNGNAGANALTGTAFDDTISGALGRDTLAGGAGDDLFTGAAAEISGDLVNGGAGFDRIVVTGSAQANLGSSIAQVEWVQGRNVNASAVASGLNLVADAELHSLLTGGAGADTLHGGAGEDQLNGGLGADRFVVDSRAALAGDTLAGGAGEDVVLFTHGAEDELAAYLEGLGLPAGPVLLLGLGEGSLNGVEEIRIADAAGDLDDAPASVLADGSLQGSLFLPGPELSIELITDESFIWSLLVAGTLDPLIEFVNPGLLTQTREQQLVEIMAVINNDPEFALNVFNAVLEDVLPDQEIELGAYDPAFTAAGLRITGNHGANMISGTRFTDTLAGNGGDDVFLVSAGAHHPLDEAIQGGAGFDAIWFTSELDGDTLTLGFSDAGVETVQARGLGGGTVAAVNIDAGRFGAAIDMRGNDGANALTGSRFGDVLVGFGGSDTLHGGRGDDSLHGGDGGDALLGGLGNDLIVNPRSGENDSVNGGAGSDTVVLDEGLTYDMTLLARRDFAGIERIEFGGDGNANTLVAVFARVLESVGDGGVLFVDGSADDEVRLVEDWTMGASAGGYVDWTYEDLDTGASATLRVDEDIAVGRVFVATTGTDSMVGGPTHDAFVFTPQTLTEGDVADGGAGFDEVELHGAGDSFNLSVVSLAGIERIRLVDGGNVTLGGAGVDVLGSTAEDFVEADAADLPASIDGGEGFDTVLVHSGGEATISGGAFSSIEQTLFDGGGALTLQGAFSSNLSAQDDEDYTLTLDGATNIGVSLGGGNDSIVAGTALDEGSGSVSAGGGADTLDGVPLGVYGVSLGDGDDLYLLSEGPEGRDVSGGSGFDTVSYDGSAARSISLGNASGFEVLAAGGATGSLTVSVQFGAEQAVEITTGSGDDSITLSGLFDGVSETVHSGGGADTVAGAEGNDSVSLEGGNDVFALDWSTWNGFPGFVDAGSGLDTLLLSMSDLSADPLTVRLDLTENIEGASNFENVDAQTFQNGLTIHAAAGGSVIATGAGADQIHLGAGVDLVQTGGSNESGDTVTGALSAGDDITLSATGDIFALTGPADASAHVDASEGFDNLVIGADAGALVVDLSAAGTVFEGFEALQGSEATGDIEVTVDGSVQFLATGSGDDILHIAVGTSIFLFDPASLGLGNDRADFDPSSLVDGGGGSDWIDYVDYLGVGEWDLIDLTGVFFNYTGFENFDGSGSATDLWVEASGQGGTILTGSGDDTLDGAAGNDTMGGGAGDDIFRIDTPGDVDVIQDFAPGSDLLVLSPAVFAGIFNSVGTLDPGLFALGTGAGDADDYIVYDQASGSLYYDAGGNAGDGPVLFAVLPNMPALTADDIFVSL